MLKTHNAPLTKQKQHKTKKSKPVQKSEKENVHLVKRPYICNQCHWPFSQKRHLAVHMRTHTHQATLHACLMCATRFPRKFSLERHMEHDHGVRLRFLPEETPVGDEYCPECQSLFDAKTCVKVAYCQCGHVSCVECVVKAELGCGQCATEAAEKTTQEEEVEESVEFDNELQAEYQMEVTETETELEFDLDSDEQIYSDVESDNRRVYKCKYCKYSIEFVDRKDLGIHMQYAHANMRPFPCNVCQWPFPSSKELERHQRTHRKKENTVFTCAECSMSFQRKSARDRHVEKVHLKWKRI